MSASRRRYPRWVKHQYSEMFYLHRDRWIYEVHHGPEHPEGRFVAAGTGFRERFSTAEEAKSFFESLYELEHAREKFDFPVVHVPRIAKGTQKVVLPCPVINGRVRNGWLSVRWNPRFSTVQWDYGEIDAAWPECERFDIILSKTNWDRELIRRLIDMGWRWQNITKSFLCVG
jgi:hypothetical protein